MTDDFAIEGEEVGYVPCFELSATLVVEEEGAISGLGTGRVARGRSAASLPAPEREAIVGSAVGFVPKPCEEVGCCVDAFGRDISATSVTNATSSGAFLGASDLGPDWDVLLVSDQDRVRVYVSEGPPPAWVTTISIATNGFEGHAQAKINTPATNELGTTKSMRFRLQALPGTGDYAARVIFNPIGYSETGPGGIFGGGVTLGSGLGGLGGAPYVSINPFAAGSAFVQNQSEIAFTASTWSIFEYYQIETPTPIPPSFWVAGTTYTFEVLSEDLGGGSIRTTATVSAGAGSYSVSITRPTLSLPEYDAPTLTGPEIAILRSFSFADPDEWIIAVECVQIPEYCCGAPLCIAGNWCEPYHGSRFLSPPPPLDFSSGTVTIDGCAPDADCDIAGSTILISQDTAGGNINEARVTTTCVYTSWGCPGIFSGTLALASLGSSAWPNFRGQDVDFRFLGSGDTADNQPGFRISRLHTGGHSGFGPATKITCLAGGNGGSSSPPFFTVDLGIEPDVPVLLNFKLEVTPGNTLIRAKAWVSTEPDWQVIGNRGSGVVPSELSIRFQASRTDGVLETTMDNIQWCYDPCCND